MSFFNKFGDNTKFNIFLGDYLVKKAGYPTRVDIAKLLFNEMKETRKGYVTDENSLFEVSQVYLDGVVSSRSALLKKIKNLYAAERGGISLLNIFSESNKINSIFSMNYDVIFDSLNSDRLIKVLPTNTDIPYISENFVKHYKLLGDVENFDKIFISIQDFRKFKILDFYKEFIKSIKHDLNENPTIILGLDLDDTDFLNMLEVFITEKKQDMIFAVSNSNVLKTKTLERLNSMGIKLLPHSEEDFVKELATYIDPSISFEEREEYVGKKLFR